MPRPDLSSWGQGAGASYLGLFFVAVVAIGGWGGTLFDQRFHCSPWGAIIGVGLGMAAGIREMLKVLKENSPPPRSPGGTGPSWSRPGFSAPMARPTPTSEAGPSEGANQASDTKSKS